MEKISKYLIWAYIFGRPYHSNVTRLYLVAGLRRYVLIACVNKIFIFQKKLCSLLE